MGVVLRRVRSAVSAWFIRQFSTDWTPLRFQPILFLAAWGGTWGVFLADFPEKDELAVGLTESLGEWGWHGWLALSFTAPVMLMLAYSFVYLGSGYLRYFGFWFRLGADCAQLAAISAFLMAQGSWYRGVDNDYRVYFLSLCIAVLAFLVIMVIRDVWQLMLTERIASRLRDEDRGAELVELAKPDVPDE